MVVVALFIKLGESLFRGGITTELLKHMEYYSKADNSVWEAIYKIEVAAKRSGNCLSFLLAVKLVRVELFS